MVFRPSVGLRHIGALLTLLVMLVAAPDAARGQVAVRGATVYTMAGQPIRDGVVVVRDGKISSVGAAAEIRIPQGFEVLEAEVVTPGLVDAHTVVGLSGILNSDHDQDQIERSTAIQPQLRAIDAYNPHEPLIEWVRGFGVTTMHTGHAPGELISGQTMIVKTVGNTVEAAVLKPVRAVAATLSPMAEKSGAKSPGTRGKMVAMLREVFLKAQRYRQKKQKASQDEKAEPLETDLQLEVLTEVLDRKLPLMVTANRSQDIAAALRLAREFDIELWLDHAAEAYLLIDEIREASVPVILHPTMARAFGEKENLSFETAARLMEAGIPVAIQSGYESYVPKTRVILFEAALAAANGLTREQALATITRNAAEILGIADRVGSLEVGKDGDLVLFDGDPFEYTSHVTGVVIEGRVVSREVR